MSNEMNFTVAPTMKAPTAAITRVEPKLLTDCNKCEGNINVGVFFDGTNNNRDFDKPKLQDSNVVRLFEAYWNNFPKGYMPRYIPGVGTAFPEIREKGTSGILGNGFGIGCEQRVLFGLLHVFNAIYMNAFGGAQFLNSQQVSALCCNSLVQSSADDADCITLGRIGLSHGLMLPPIGPGRRVMILKDLAKRLEAALVKGRPHVKECFIDVFGFSRGAAEARVFCSWLDEILTDGKLAGVTVHFRFLGLMDTVASAGFVSSVGAALTGGDGGHSGWAEARYLRIPASVQNCVHMVAAHELRKNFPLDTLINGGKMPPHCQEFVYPGAHSDVGGGYAPGELGISFDSDKYVADAKKLSQIPLNHMLACAIAAGAPLNKERARIPQTNYDPFALSPLVQKAYDDFVTYSTLKPRQVHEWLQPYLNWRWQVRMNFAILNHVRNAYYKDRALLVEYNDRLIAEAEALIDRPKAPRFDQMLKPATLLMDMVYNIRHQQPREFDEEARRVLAIAKAAPPTDDRLHQLFDLFVHDSLAGFNQHAVESTGYWRYRKGFLGDEKHLIVEADAPPGTDTVVA